MKKVAFEWYAMFEGCFLAALGLYFLQANGLLVGGTAGVAAISQHFFGFTLGTWFFVVNLPFFVISLKQMGKAFTVKSLLCIALVSVLSDTFALLITIDSMPVWLASFIGGGLIGIGLLILFRHNASLGGVNILALYLEKTKGIHSGKVILSVDLMVLALALIAFPIEQILYSAIGFVVLTSVIGRYHKKAPIEQNTVAQNSPSREVEEFDANMSSVSKY
jgi:uncharacterized membrane-anchored protein YitT (DUF2179 family)